ncbi:hypothetical protein Y032_0039g81 [Ancylostoma ceylanicum]|uniref:Uncharacterized protein n=1 Tax=Ancylostoma ceylanicum TaxID=53326 RepID=A0A016UI93_9BILA|nr:hypothetical protein Y032_0039g81 [Ancylostoma ceylanicum]
MLSPYLSSRSRRDSAITESVYLFEKDCKSLHQMRSRSSRDRGPSEQVRTGSLIVGVKFGCADNQSTTRVWALTTEITCNEAKVDSA